jgi:hypothetical protein
MKCSFNHRGDSFLILLPQFHRGSYGKHEEKRYISILAQKPSRPSLSLQATDAYEVQSEGGLATHQDTIGLEDLSPALKGHHWY